MVDGVEGGGQVKEDEGRYFFVFGSKEKIIVDAEKSSFSRMEFSKGGLKDRNGREGFEVVEKTFMDDTLE